MAGLGVTDIGLNTAANIAKIAAVAVAVINTAAAIDIAKDQERLARDYLNISKEQTDYYLNTYAPCENAEIQEACAEPLYDPHTETTIGRAVVSARGMFAGKPTNDIICFDRYNTGRNASIIKDQVLAEATAVSTAANLGRRIEEDYAEAKDDLRWARRSQALSRGRDMMAQAVTFSGFAFGLYGKLGEQAAKGAAGAIGYLGYANYRGDLERPQQAAPIVESIGTPVMRTNFISEEDQREINRMRYMDMNPLKGPRSNIDPWRK